jgi:glycosyltransferase involved in cell wall biosynthesis
VTLRLLHVLHDPLGGGAAYAGYLAAHARAHGAEVVMALPGSASADADTAVDLRGPSLRRTARLVAAIRSSDVVHAHGARAAAWALPLLAMRPSVVTFHGLHPLRRPAGRAYQLQARTLIRSIFAAADATVAVARSELADLEAVVGCRTKLHLVRNAVPELEPITDAERRAARTRLHLEDETLAVLYLGRLENAKDPFAALAVARASEQDGVVLLVAGDGPLHERVRAGAGPNVSLLGYVTDTRELLAACDIVLNTSLWEGLSLTLLEAMWAGRPIVASAVPGNVEAIGDAGLLVPAGDVAAFRHCLLRLRDPSVRSDHTARGRARVRAEFSFQEMLAGVDRVYAGVLGRPPW